MWLSVVIKLEGAGLRFLDTFNCIPFSELQFSKRIQPSVCNSYYVVKFCISSSNEPNFKISNLAIVQKRLFLCVLSKSLLRFYFFFLTQRDCFNMQKLGFILSSCILVRFCLEFTLRTFIPPSQLGEVLDKCFLDKLFLDKIFTCFYTE